MSSGREMLNSGNNQQVLLCMTPLKFDGIFFHVALKFDRWAKVTIGHIFYANSSFVHHFIATCLFKPELHLETPKLYLEAKICFGLFYLGLWPLTLTFCMGITSVNDNHPWKFHDDPMTRTLWKRCHRQIDEQTDRRTVRPSFCPSVRMKSVYPTFNFVEVRV